MSNSVLAMKPPHVRFKSMGKRRRQTANKARPRHRLSLDWLRFCQFLDRHSREIAMAAVLFASARLVATDHVFNHTSDEPARIAFPPAR
jgi:hypothetical protein